MESWYVIQPQPTINGGFENDEWDSYVTDAFDEVLTETKLGQTVYLCNGLYDAETELFEVEYETQAVVQNVTPDAYTQGWKRQILTRISDMLADYKYVKVKDTKGNWQIYLIMTMPDTNQIYTKAPIHECNYILKWQDSTGKVFSYPCSIENASQYNTGENSVNSVMRTGFSQLMAWMSFDENTLKIGRTNRFFVDYDKTSPLVYRTTSMNHVDYSYNENRIIRIVLTEDEYNPDVDNVELWLCDYIDPENIPTPTEPIEVTYVGLPEIRMGGRKTFKVDSETAITFSLVGTDAVISKLRINQENNQCVVWVENDSSLVGNHFKLLAQSDADQSELLVSIKGVM